MSILPLAVCLIPVTLLVVTGFLIKYKKAYWLISGYNTMSAEKKKNVDTEALGEFIANVCFIIAGIVLAATVLLALKQTAIAGIMFVLIFPVIIYTLVHAQKFDGNNFNSEGKMKTGSKAMVGSIVAVLVLITIMVGVMMSQSSKPAGYTLENGMLTISGMYGQEIDLRKVSSLDMKDTIPEVLLRTNGSALGSMLKGNFKLEYLGQAKLFIDRSESPFIFIYTDGTTIIINCGQGEETKAFYEKLKTEWQASGGGK